MLKPGLTIGAETSLNVNTDKAKRIEPSFLERFFFIYIAHGAYITIKKEVSIYEININQFSLIVHTVPTYYNFWSVTCTICTYKKVRKDPAVMRNFEAKPS